MKQGGIIVCVLLLPFVCCLDVAVAYPTTYDRSADVPDLGQHSSDWCWAAAASNCAYWWATEKGHTYLACDYALQIDPDSKTVENPWYCCDDGYRRLLRKFCETTFHDTNKNGSQDPGETNYAFSETVSRWDYYTGLKQYFKYLDVKAVGQAAGYHNFGGTCSLDYIAEELSKGEDVLLVVSGPSEHVITLTSYHKEGADPTAWYIGFKDSWNYSTNGPDHSNELGSGDTHLGYCGAGYDPATELTFVSGVTGIWTVEYVMSVSIPEPATMSLLGVGLLAVLRRRRKH